MAFFSEKMLLYSLCKGSTFASWYFFLNKVGLKNTQSD